MTTSTVIPPIPCVSYVEFPQHRGRDRAIYPEEGRRGQTGPGGNLRKRQSEGWSDDGDDL